MSRSNKQPPPFDPNAVYDVVKSGDAPAFDPSKPFEEANPSDARAASPESWAHWLARKSYQGINPLGAAAMEYMGGDTPTLMAHAANTLALKNPEYIPGVKKYLDESNAENPGSAMMGRAQGMVALGAAQAAVPASALPQIAAATGMGLAQKPDGQMAMEDDLKSRGTQGLLSGGLSALLLGGGKLAGNAGDRLMQMAVGRKKYTPGVGTTLANEGIYGTKSMMRNQVEEAKKAAYGEMLQATAGNPAVYDSMPVANRVLQVARSKQVPGSTPSPLDVPYMNEAQQAAVEIANRPMETLSQMLRRRVLAGNRGYSNVTDAAKQGVLADISKAEQIGYSNILKNAAPEIIPVDARYAALAKAAHGLRDEDTIRMGTNLIRIPRTPNGVLDYLPSSVVESLLGQAMVKGSQATPMLMPLVPAATRQKGTP